MEFKFPAERLEGERLEDVEIDLVKETEGDVGGKKENTWKRDIGK